ncbi:MAG: hypothetical protein PSX37_01905 [bacterium]|nr:hypothetical protein [bacterium]
MSGDLLFDVDPVDLSAPEQKSAGVRLTEKREDFIRRGFHPLANLMPGLMLRPDAPREKAAPGPRCGSCQHRVQVGSGNRDYWKCGFYRSSGSAQSDLRLWWPACTRYVEGE